MWILHELGPTYPRKLSICYLYSFKNAPNGSKASFAGNLWWDNWSQGPSCIVLFYDATTWLLQCHLVQDFSDYFSRSSSHMVQLASNEFHLKLWGICWHVSHTVYCKQAFCKKCIILVYNQVGTWRAFASLPCEVQSSMPWDSKS